MMVSDRHLVEDAPDLDDNARTQSTITGDTAWTTAASDAKRLEVIQLFSQLSKDAKQFTVLLP